MAEPEVRGAERFGLEVFAFGEFFNDGRRKTRAADAGEQSQKRRHHGHADFFVGRELLQVLHHAGKASAFSQFNFETHHKIQSPHQVPGAGSQEHRLGGIDEQTYFRLLNEPQPEAAQENRRAQGDFEAKKNDERCNRAGEKEKNKHSVRSEGKHGAGAAVGG